MLAHVPRQVPLTITASPAKGQDATIDLAVKLTGDGYLCHRTCQLGRSETAST